MQIHIAIKSCHIHSARRLACASTWLGAWEPDAFFVLGRPTPSEGGPVIINTLACKVPDIYEQIGPKVHYACMWALEHAIDYLFVCDDDTYVHVPRLLRAVPVGKDYVGWLRPPGLHSISMHCNYIQGSGYWLSARAMDYVVRCKTLLYDGPDDCLMGAALWGKVEFTHDGRYENALNVNHERIPRADNDVISTHKCLPPIMYKVHELCKQVL